MNSVTHNFTTDLVWLNRQSIKPAVRKGEIYTFGAGTPLLMLLYRKSRDSGIH